MIAVFWKYHVRQKHLKKFKLSTFYLYPSAHTYFFVECKQLQSNTLTTIRGPVSCHITELCTRVECCVEVVPINRTVFMFLDVDTCNYQMSVGIENLVFNISLLHYEFGNADILRMGEVATLE